MMADAWGTQNIVQALPSTEAKVTPDAVIMEATITESAKASNEAVHDPKAHGWVEKQSYDYATYNLSNKEQYEKIATEGVGARGDWASNAAVYHWDGEHGDVGPEHPELERQLFGDENHVKAGIEFQKLKNIEVVQESIVKILPIANFEDAGLHPVMLKNVQLAGYDKPTPVQSYCIPAILHNHDVIACAQTGSGKTAAFLVPTLSKLMGKAKKLAAPRPNPATFREGIDAPVRAEPLILIVCPSRELATQIFDEARRFCYRTMLRPCVVYGGGPVVEQIAQLQKGCDVLIGTPGRLCDFINRPHVLSLHRLKYLIIDEADEMLNADWDDELKTIMNGGDQEVGNIIYMMFSATFPKAARDLAKEHLSHEHIRIRVGRAGSSHQNIKQNVVFVEANVKRQALVDLLYSKPPARTIIFVNAKRAADELDHFLWQKDLPVTSIHSDRTQREREDALRAFRTGKCPIMIATGVSARGLDIRNVMHVINFDLPSPQFGGIEEYTHRIGRTGRAGNVGIATSFYNDRDADLAENLTKTLMETGQEVPDFLEQYKPAIGVDLKFEADSDYGGDEATGDAGGDGGGWGTSAASGADASAGGGWGADATAPTVPAPAADAVPTASGWDAPIPAPAPATSGWHTPIHAPTPAVGGWGGPTPTPTLAAGEWDAPIPAPAPAAGGWGSPTPTPAPAAGGWGASTTVPAPAVSEWGVPTPAPVSGISHRVADNNGGNGGW